MKQLIVFCEGPTEQGFCARVLGPYLFPDFDGRIYTLAVGRQDNHHVFGIQKYAKLRKFIINTLKSRKDSHLRFTTMIDLYGSSDDFPGRAANVRDPANPSRYVEALEKAFAEDVADPRFIANFQLHEYEALLFADPTAFKISFENCDVQVRRLQGIAAEFPNVEHINDGRATAPSKRIIAVLPQYDGRKTSAGPDIAEYIGMKKLCEKCPHFAAWVQRLAAGFTEVA